METEPHCGNIFWWDWDIYSESGGLGGQTLIWHLPVLTVDNIDGVSSVDEGSRDEGERGEAVEGGQETV